MEGIKNFLDLIEVQPFWLILVIILILILAAVSPYRLELKIEETEEKNGKKTYRIYRYKDK